MFLWLQGFSLNENREWTDSVVILLRLQFQSLNEVTLGNPVLSAELKPGQVDVRYFKITKMVKKKKKSNSRIWQNLCRSYEREFQTSQKSYIINVVSSFS